MAKKKKPTKKPAPKKMREASPLAVTLTAETPDDIRKLRRMLGVDALYGALWDIGQEIFRPVRKHGFQDDALRQALEAADKTEVDSEVRSTETGEAYKLGAGTQLVSLLEKRFFEILDDHGIDMDEYE